MDIKCAQTAWGEVKVATLPVMQAECTYVLNPKVTCTTKYTTPQSYTQPNGHIHNPMVTYTTKESHTQPNGHTYNLTYIALYAPPMNFISLSFSHTCTIKQKHIQPENYHANWEKLTHTFAEETFTRHSERGEGCRRSFSEVRDLVYVYPHLCLSVHSPYRVWKTRRFSWTPALVC